MRDTIDIPIIGRILLYAWENGFTCKKYWRTSEGNAVLDNFREVLKTFNCVEIGRGQCAQVFKMPGHDLVVKVLLVDGQQILFTDQCDMIPQHLVLPVVASNDGYCCLQEYVDCSENAQLEAMRQLEHLYLTCTLHKSNVGLRNGIAVVIDQW